MAESLNEDECLRLLGATRVGRLAYTGREGPTVVVYKLHEGSVGFHPLQGTFTEEDLRTGIAHAEYQVAADPFPWLGAGAAPLMRVRPSYIRGRRSYPCAIPAD